MVRRVARIWMRMGDQGDYEDFDDAFEAGEKLGSLLEATGTQRIPVVKRYGRYGVEVGSYFRGPLNYVSLFWGDEDAQPTRDASQQDVVEFRSGIAEGADIRVAPRKPAKPKSRAKPRSPGTSVRGLR